MKAAVILFPGMNCENETMRALTVSGFHIELVRWNQHVNLDDFSCFVIPGGFSYEDRIRAGVIAAKHPLLDEIKKQSKKGKPVIGICNGAQVLVESGLVPGFSSSAQMGLAPNKNPEVNGYYSTWVKIRPAQQKKNAFNRLFTENDVIDIPVAHGEGRFATKEDNEKIKNLIAFQYCDYHRAIDQSFPTNPNGSLLNIAGITNEAGNVLAIMPHPERASFDKQTQAYGFIPKGLLFFKSMKEYIKEEL